MWIVLPSIYLAITHIAGDNLALVPDVAVVLGKDVYAVTILSYLIFGSLISAIMAWAGVKTKQELIFIAKQLYGYKGKKITAAIIIFVCLPASILTGGHYSGYLVHAVFGLPLSVAAVLCITLFAFLTMKNGSELVKLSNYVSLLLVPCILFLIMMQGFEFPGLSFNFDKINWLLVLALIGYNAGGMRAPLIVETATHLSQKRYQTIFLVILAKIVEGVFTIILTHFVLMADVSGPLAIVNRIAQIGGSPLFYVFIAILFCTFTSAMIPAMMVNARQIRIITGLSFGHSLAIATLLACMGSMMKISTIINILSAAGLFTLILAIYLAYSLHKYRSNYS